MIKTETVLVRVEGGRAFFCPKDSQDDAMLRVLYGCGPQDEVQSMYDYGIDAASYQGARPIDSAIADFVETAKQSHISVQAAEVDSGDPSKAVLTIAFQADVDRAFALDISSALKEAGYDIKARLMADGRILQVIDFEGRAWLASDARQLAELDDAFAGDIPPEAAAKAVQAVKDQLGLPGDLHFNMRDLLASDDSATFCEFGHRLYKSTACGPWVKAISRRYGEIYYEKPEARDPSAPWLDDCVGILIGSIVEGSDAEVSPLELLFPFTQEQFEHAVNDVDAEADRLWQEAHGPIDVSDEDIDEPSSERG